MAAQTFMRVLVPPSPFYDPLGFQLSPTLNHTSNEVTLFKNGKLAAKPPRRRQLYKRILADHGYEEGMSRNEIERQLHRIEFHRMHYREIEDMERVLGSGVSFNKRRAYKENFSHIEALSNVSSSAK